MTMRRRRGGFTLLELVVVLAIMGFLIAMLAPKLATFVRDSVPTIDDTSQRRYSENLSSYVEKTFHLPDDLITLVQEPALTPTSFRTSTTMK